MRIRCFGARGSIPVSGQDYLRYGGNTTCLEIRNSADDVLLLDAGSGIREAGNTLLAQGRQNISLLLTHAHWDHIMGFPFFKPLYRSTTRMKIWGCSDAQDSLREMLTRVMSAPYFPINYEAVHANISYESACEGNLYHLNKLTVESIALNHPNGGSGYRFTENGKRFVFLTDNELCHPHEGGLPYEDYVAFCRKADLLIHDAEYCDEEYDNRRGWGHSTTEQAVRLALDAEVRQLGLFHHNQDRIDSEIDAMVAACRRSLFDAGADISCFALSQGMELLL